MRPLHSLGVLALSATVVLSVGDTLPAEDDLSRAEIAPERVTGGIDWIYDYAEAKKLAEKNGKPLFVVFRCER